MIHKKAAAVFLAASAVAAFAGTTGVLLEIAGVVAAVIVWRSESRAHERMLVGDYVERHSFPSDTVSDFVTTATASTSIGEARARMDAWRSGYLQCERAATARRSAAAKKAAATRRRTAP